MAKRKGIYFTEEECDAIMGAFNTYHDMFNISMVDDLEDLGGLASTSSIKVLGKLKKKGYVFAEVILDDIASLS